MKKWLTKIDVHKQSFFFFKWHWLVILCILAASVYLTIHWKDGLAKALLDNIFVYLPNYLTHEMLGHNLVGNIFFQALYSSHRAWGEWIATLAGNGVETLVPLLLVLGALRIRGGRWFLPPLLYWLATTLYGAGVYAQDARACSLPLTSSDMVTTYKPGEICGDWNHILEPIGLLAYDQWFAYTFLFLGSLCLVLAIYSAWYYWNHMDQYLAKPIVQKPPQEDNWQPPNIYTP